VPVVSGKAVFSPQSVPPDHTGTGLPLHSFYYSSVKYKQILSIFPGKYNNFRPQGQAQAHIFCGKIFSVQSL
jgi:hypothetical protein